MSRARTSSSEETTQCVMSCITSAGRHEMCADCPGNGQGNTVTYIACWGTDGERVIHSLPGQWSYITAQPAEGADGEIVIWHIHSCRGNRQNSHIHNQPGEKTAKMSYAHCDCIACPGNRWRSSQSRVDILPAEYSF